MWDLSATVCIDRYVFCVGGWGGGIAQHMNVFRVESYV